MLSPKITTRNQIRIGIKDDELKTSINLIFSNITIAEIINIIAEKKLPIRKEKGNILYFPPHASFPKGAPNTNNNWNIDIAKKIITHKTAASSTTD
jgi:hypothetical protein